MSDGLNFLNIENKPAVIGVKPARPALNLKAVFAAVAAIFLSLFLRLQLLGWLIILFAIPYVVICLIHLLVHWKASRYLTRTLWLLLISSNVYLILAFLLQWDIGDGESGWLIISWLLWREHASRSWPGVIMNILVFIPELVTLVFAYWLSRKEARHIQAEQVA
jgi:hypothetical protein